MDEICRPSPTPLRGSPWGTPEGVLSNEMRECAEMYLAGKGVEAIGKHFGHYKGWVIRRLKLAGVWLKRNKDERNQLIARCVKLRAQGMIYKNIGLAVGMSKEWVREHCGDGKKQEPYKKRTKEPRCKQCEILLEFAGEPDANGNCPWCSNGDTTLFEPIDTWMPDFAAAMVNQAIFDQNWDWLLSEDCAIWLDVTHLDSKAVQMRIAEARRDPLEIQRMIDAV